NPLLPRHTVVKDVACRHEGILRTQLPHYRWQQATLTLITYRAIVIGPHHEQAALTRPLAVVRHRIGLAVDEVDNGLGPPQAVGETHHGCEAVGLAWYASYTRLGHSATTEK